MNRTLILIIFIYLLPASVASHYFARKFGLIPAVVSDLYYKFPCNLSCLEDS